MLKRDLQQKKNNLNYFNMKYSTQQLNNRHYQAIKRRGLITNKTSIKDFLNKHNEETQEMIIESIAFKNRDKNNFIQEAIDAIMVLENMIIHLGYDIEKEKEINTIHQEKRND